MKSVEKSLNFCNYTMRWEREFFNFCPYLSVFFTYRKIDSFQLEEAPSKEQNFCSTRSIFMRCHNHVNCNSEHASCYLTVFFFNSDINLTKTASHPKFMTANRLWTCTVAKELPCLITKFSQQSNDYSLFTACACRDWWRVIHRFFKVLLTC